MRITKRGHSQNQKGPLDLIRGWKGASTPTWVLAELGHSQIQNRPLAQTALAGCSVNGGRNGQQPGALYFRAASPGSTIPDGGPSAIRPRGGRFVWHSLPTGTIIVGGRRRDRPTQRHFFAGTLNVIEFLFVRVWRLVSGAAENIDGEAKLVVWNA